MLSYLWSVAGRNDDRHGVENPAVVASLIGQPPQVVGTALELVADQRSVDHGDVNPSLSAAKNKLVENRRVQIGSVLSV